MSKRQHSKDEALEALDFIVNVLKEHEHDLDKLINELGNVTQQLGATGELSGKIEKIEERITGLQNVITNLIGYISASPREPTQIPVAAKPEPKTEPAAAPTPTVAPVMHGPPVILRCKQWEDFQSLASQAQTVSFMAKEAERTFQPDAL